MATIRFRVDDFFIYIFRRMVATIRFRVTRRDVDIRFPDFCWHDDSRSRERVRLSGAGEDHVGAIFELRTAYILSCSRGSAE